MRQRGIIKREHDTIRQPSVPRPRAFESNSPEPAKQVQNRTQNIPRHFDHHEGNEERRDAVHPTRSLPHFEYTSVVVESADDLIRERGGEEHRDKHGENLVLRVLKGVSSFEET